LHIFYAVRKSQGIPEQPGPVYAEVQPRITDAQVKMRINIAYGQTIAVGKFKTGDNVAYESGL